MSYNKIFYLDNVSTNPINPEVLSTYTMLLEKYYANKSAIHALGREVYKLHEKSREEVLSLLNVKNSRLIFTAGATEANNMAIKSVAMANKAQGKHLITTNIEHPSVHNSFKFLEEYLDFEVTYLDVEADGRIDLNKLKAALREDTLLVSIMAVNNEVGAINDVAAWTKLVKDNSKAYTHSDMVQALGNIDLDFNNLDIATFSAHKINGVKGSGFLVIRDHIDMVPLISGGDQEFGIRPGTENSPANIVLAKTVRIALEEQVEKNEKLKALKDHFYDSLKDNPQVRFNSNQEHSVNTLVNISVLGVNSEIMLNALGQENMYVSAGSTCQSDVHKRSRVLMSLDKPLENQQTRVRISLNTDLTIEDIDTIVLKITEIGEKYAV